MAQVKWDDAPQQAGGQQPLEIDITGGMSESQLRAQQAAAAAQAPIDLSQVVWDDAPQASKPDFSGVTSTVSSTANDVPRPYKDSAFSKVLGFFEGPAPIQGNTLQERQADYQSRNPALKGLVGAGRAVDRNLRGIGQLTGTSTQAMDEGAKGLNQVLAGDTATNLGDIAAEGLALAVPGSKIAALPKMATRVAASTGLGAASGYVGAADSQAGRLGNAALGGAFGAGGEVVGQGLRLLGSRVTPEIMALYNAARQRGIELTPAQLSNSQFLKRAENMLKNIPFTGATRTWEKQLEQFNTAVSKTFGENAPKITPDVFAAAKSRIGQQFDELSARSTLNVSDRLLEGLGAIQKEASEVAEDGTIRAVNSVIDRFLRQTQDGVLPGPAYKSLDSQLGKIMANGGEKAAYIGQVRDTLREAMDESIPAALKDAWTQARSQYRSLKTVEPLVAKSADGTISPAQLMGRVTADKSGKAAMAAGRGGELGTLARIGQAMKAPSSSGTAENMLAGGLFNPVNWPSYAAGGALGLTAGRALNSNALASLMATPVANSVLLNQLARLAAPGAIATTAPIVTDTKRPNNGR
ncbi:hypothetical protein CEK68_11960 [Xanthomonas sp. LMG 12461]|nr:hypothetical protein CEK68_11960 [Xanthomonas sp. LMG 12461]